MAILADGAEWVVALDLRCGFLRDRVETYCQVDGGGRLLWPQGMTVKDVYETTFQDWLRDQHPLLHLRPFLCQAFGALLPSQNSHTY